MKAAFSLGYVSHRTGLSPQLIRTWESRHAVVKPPRDAGNRRRYTEEQIQRLELLRDLTLQGHRIGDLARCTTADLVSLARAEPIRTTTRPTFGKPTETDWISRLLEATRSFDAARFEQIIDRALIECGHLGFLENVAAPFARELGERWRSGELKVAHEHFASAQLATTLGRMMQAGTRSRARRCLIVTTPTEQWHELGALLVGATASCQGWCVVYLGPSLAAEEIVAAAVTNAARAVALSIVYPDDDPDLPAELLRLRKLLPRDISILAGGRAAPSYAETLQAIGAVPAGSLREFSASLDSIRRPTNGKTACLPSKTRNRRSPRVPPARASTLPGKPADEKPLAEH